MSPEPFAAYLERQITDYAEVKVKAGAWPADGALEKARHDFGKFLPEGLATPGQHLSELISEPGGEVVGQLWLELESKREPGSAFVYDIRVAPAFQGRGYGREAMLLAEAQARQHGCREMKLMVFAFNAPARALYEKLGYAVVDMLMRKPL
jgi:ribosomal protein S18 acetylase RimI-like enzyme